LIFAAISSSFVKIAPPSPYAPKGLEGKKLVHPIVDKLQDFLPL